MILGINSFNIRSGGGIKQLDLSMDVIIDNDKITEVYIVINRDLKGRYKSKKIKSNLLNLKNRIKSSKSNYESDFENYKTKMNEF
jgi:hypothetical protein